MWHITYDDEVPEDIERRRHLKISYPHFVGVRFDELSWRMLKKMCEKLNVSRSEAIRRAVVFTYCMYIQKKPVHEVLEKIIEEGDII